MYFSWHKIAVLSVFSLSFVCFPVAADTFTVDTNSDADLSACTATPNDCSLRGAINRANANGVPDTVAFSIPGSGFKTLVPATPLPALTGPQTFIDGNSQPGYNGLPLIVLSGAQIPAPALANGLHITTSGCRIRGLTLYGWENAIKISSAQGVNNLIEGCLIGTDVLGRSVPSSTNNTGIAITGSAQNNTIGGTTVAQRNIISANRAQGVLLADQGTTINKIWGNYIGTDRYGNALGEMAQRNGVGVTLRDNASSNAIGGDSGAGNLISGNRISGVHLHTANGNGIYGNRIGTDATGLKAIGNGLPGSGGFGSGAGIYLNFSEGCSIGGSIGERNIISGHTTNGILIDGSNNTVASNYIGVDATGTKALGNLNGIALLNNGSTNNVIGGPGTGNVISGNDTGIIADSFSDNQAFSGKHLIEGNFIGTNARGIAAVPNRIGISLRQTSDNRIGRPQRASRNLIAGNSETNIHLSGSNRNLIEGNFIGTNSSGSAPLGNFSTVAGIYLERASHANRIGGPSIEARNIISGHAGHGIFINGYSSNNAVQNNYIGVDATGTKAAPNGKDGITMESGASLNTIGGPLRNVISGNLGCGISIIGISSGANTEENTIAGNYIGINARGDGILGNSEGILINQGAQRCTIGSNDVALRNVISGNGELKPNRGSSFGIRIDGIKTINHTVINCYIGVDATGSKSGFGNNGPGVLLSNTHGNRIGIPGAPRNVISGNKTSNIELRSSSRNTIQNDFIGPKADGTGPVAMPVITFTHTAGIFISSFSSSTPSVGSGGNLIGGTEAGARNVISGNNDAGIFLDNSAVNTRIQGNFIGTNAAGNMALPNSRFGIFDSGKSTFIGGATPQARNVISGNGIGGGFTPTFGVSMSGPNGVLQGNFIGTDARGTAALPNLNFGVYAAGTKVIVGGITNRPGTGAGNVISGNGQTGIAVDSSNSIVTSDVHVSGNLIGTDVSGSAAIPNGIGIILYTGENTTIGNGQPSGRNIISGNRGSGVQFESLSGTSGGIPQNNRIQGNYIGTDITGQKPLPNVVGVRMRQGSVNVVGGATSRPGVGVGNVISGNLLAGVYVERVFNVRPGIFGNTIGVAADGITPLPNKKSRPDETGREGAGILVEQFVLIGGPDTNPSVPGKFGNLIAYNEGAGVRVLSGQPAQIRANSIFANGALGIDQGEVGVTPGVAAENVSEPRFIIPPFPVLQSATQSTPNAPLIIQGYVEASSGQLPVDVFASDEPDPSGFGEGKTYLGSFNLGTGQGIRFITFNQVLPVNADLTGKWITTTLSSSPSHANTSEFSEALQVVAAQGSTESSYSSINSTAYASSTNVVTAFDTRLQSIALENVTAKVNGQSVPVQSVEISGQLLTVLLPEASFVPGDKVEIFWRDLQTQDGRKLTGNTPPLVAE